MTIVGMLQGIGALSVPGRAEIEVDYSINVDRAHGRMSADGYVDGDTIELFEAMKAPFAKLRLKCGNEITVVIIKLTADGAQLQVSGPVPGY